jgi:hypothetical protein
VLLRDHDWTCYLPVNRCSRKLADIEDRKKKINRIEGLLWGCGEVLSWDLEFLGWYLSIPESGV